MRDNWWALMLCILKNITPDCAMNIFQVFSSGSKQKKVLKYVSRENITAMCSMKEKGYTYKQIGELYGISADAAQKRMRRGKEKFLKEAANE